MSMFGKYFMVQNEIYKEYCDKMWITWPAGNTRPYAILETRQVALNPSKHNDPSEKDIFDMLHEIGHIMTNTTKMKRCEQEYLATQWAIDKAKKMNFPVNEKVIDCFQKYIWEWREKSIRLKGKNVPSKDALKLTY